MYKVKYNTDGSVNRYKVRLVAKGYAQKHDIATHVRLFGARVIALITLRLVQVTDQDTFLGLCVQLPPFLLRYMHIRDATEHPQVSQVRLRTES